MSFNQLTSDELSSAAEILKAMSHPLRMSILNFLDKKGSLTVTEIHKLLNIEQSTTSHHLGILKDKGVLIAKREGKNIFYSIKNENLSGILDCISKCACM